MKYDPKESLESPIFVTKTRMPPKEEYFRALDELWESQWVTNNGLFHRKLEAKLTDFVGEGQVCLTANGTLSLLLALKVAGVMPGTEVITTPFTFPATTHAIDWLNCTPVFSDIDPVTGNIDPERISPLISSRTSAILATHVYGTPCDDARLSEICDPLDIPIIYDAAHAFGVRVDGRSALALGRASSTSFHATKLFSTGEGGAVFIPSEDDKTLIARMKNFGIVDQENIALSGLNMKLSEFHAAFGLVGFDGVAGEIERRAEIAQLYIDKLAQLPGVTIVTRGEGFTPNWSYFAIRIDEKPAGISRDALFEAMRNININCRKYFYPLMSSIPIYEHLPSARPDLLPVATRFADEVLCLPIYGDLGVGTAERIASLVHRLISNPAQDAQ